MPHGNDGEGKRAGSAGDMKGYEFPPLWGNDSFNDGAGMARLIAAANFIHSNMPNGTTYDQPTLSVEEEEKIPSRDTAGSRSRRPIWPERTSRRHQYFS